jgi:hypothetical protein
MQLDEEKVSNNPNEPSLDLARRQRREQKAKLAELRAKLASLLDVQRVEIFADPSIALELELEISETRLDIGNMTIAIEQSEQIVDDLERRQRADIDLLVFDQFATGLIEISTNIGIHAAKVAVLMKAGEELASKLNAQILEIIPENSAFRAQFRAVHQNVFQFVSAEKIRSLEESANIGEFVRSRLASVRDEIQASLRTHQLNRAALITI